MQEIFDLRLASFRGYLQPDLCVKEALVLQLLGQVGTSLYGRKTVEHDRSLAHRLQRAVDPLRAVPARQGIDGKGKLIEREPSAIGHLSDIIAQSQRIDIMIVAFRLYLHAFQQILVFWYIFCAGAR